MKMTAQIVGDKRVDRAASRDFPAWSGRELLCVDRDNTPLRGLLTVKIELNDPVSPWKDGAPELVGAVVELNIVDLNTYDGGKIVAAKGSLARIVGTVEFRPVPEPAKKAA